jgi:hypothetical protein
VFCGSSPGADPAFALAAKELGSHLARNGLGLVYGGGRVGLMGILATAALSGGGHVTGVIPHALNTKEIENNDVTELHVVSSMHERKAKMADISDAFVALPGGLGTLEELFEVATWAQLGFHAKPIALLNVSGYFDPLLRFLDHAVDQKLVKPHHRDLLRTVARPADLLEALASGTGTVTGKWMPGEER